MIETVLNMVYPAEGNYWRVMTLQEERRGVTIMHNIVQEIGSALSASVEQAGIPTTPQERRFWRMLLLPALHRNTSLGDIKSTNGAL
ncbi:hypothetical protein KKB64_01170 [Patescibacteria group bacterium]|nr:hypothetical protein [Patescibacteria group bacterium]